MSLSHSVVSTDGQGLGGGHLILGVLGEVGGVGHNEQVGLELTRGDLHFEGRLTGQIS